MADTPIAPIPDAGQPEALVADIGGTFIKFAAAMPDGALVFRETIANPSTDFGAFSSALGSLADGVDPERRLPLAISIAGTIDPDTGILVSANIACLNGCSLARELSAALGRPVAAANDADCFALGEAARGAGRGHRRVFGIILGTGVGGGIVMDGRIFEGAGGLSGEWGHGPVLGTCRVGDRTVPALPCGCGQTGCLDTIGSARGLERLDRLVTGTDRDSRAIVSAWNEGEATAAESIALYIELVAGPLAMIVNTLGPSVVPVGGGLGNSAALVAALDLATRSRILRPGLQPLLRGAELGADAALFGAAQLTGISTALVAA